VHRLRLLAVLIPVLVAAGCGFKPEPIGKLPSFPQRVVDGLGHRVTVRSQPHRIASLDPGLTESAYAVGAGATVVGATGREQYPRAARRLPRVATDGGTPNMRRLRRLHPDLVLAPDTFSAAEAAQLSRALGAPVYVASAGTVDGIEHDLDQIGAMTGNAAAGRRLARRMHEEVSAVTNAVGSQAPVPVFVDEGFFYTIDPAGNAAKLIALAGGANVATDAVPGKQYPPARLRAGAPEAYLALAGRGVTLAGLRRSKATRGLPAVRQRRFMLVDGPALNDTGPHVVAELRLLARFLHPTAHIP
jgi:cobalamin transport system substrate-binding protein